MKKVISLILVLVMCLSLCACGKSKPVKEAEAAITAIGEVTADSGEAIKTAEKLYNILTDAEKAKVKNRLTLVDAREAYDGLQSEIVYSNAKEAYEKLNEVADMCVSGMDDIYGAWYFGIYEAKDVRSTSASTFCYSMALEVPNFSSDELEEATQAYANYYGNDWCTKDKIVSWAKNDWQKCVEIVEMAFVQKDYYSSIEKEMAEAEGILQELTNTYDDYTYYPKLKDYYSSVKSYVDFFTSPSGSFNQLADTINSYENSIRTTAADVSFLFTK